MATFRKRGDKWRAEIFRAGVREGKTFETKREAQEWARVREMALGEHAVAGVVPKTLRQVIECYDREISPDNKGS